MFYEQLAGDPFPGSKGVTALNDTTGHVNFKVFKGEQLNKALDGISEQDGVVSLEYVDDFAAWLEEQEFPKGDVNHDMVVDVADAMIAVNIVLKDPKGFYCHKHADLNADKIVDVADVMGIVDIILRNGQ